MTNNKNPSILLLKSFLESRRVFTRKNLRNNQWKYSGFEELILNCGVVMEIQPLPKNINHGKPKNCYWNCQQLAFKRKDLIYVEGYAIAEDINFPLAHAWLLTNNGHAIDPTWETQGNCYLGVPFSTTWVKSFLAERKQRGKDNDLRIFESNYLEKFSLLKEGLPDDALVSLR